MSPPDCPRAADLPAWMGNLRDRYLQTDTSQFILHGNVHDVVTCSGEVWSMPDFLNAFFAPSGKVVVHYDPGRGIFFADTHSAARAAIGLVKAGFLASTKVAPRGLDKTPESTLAARLNNELELERSPEVALRLIEALLMQADLPCAVVLHYAELVAPAGPSGNLSFYDRTRAAQLHRWSLSDEVLSRDNLVLMLTSALPDLSKQLTRNPRVSTLHVPLPGALERARFLAYLQPDLDPDRGEQLTRVTAGLQLRQIKDLVSPRIEQKRAQPRSAEARDVFRGPDPLPFAAIAQRKKEILEQECYGLIEVIEPSHDFSHVGGMDEIKQALMRVAGHVKAGRTKQVPMGILFVGPMGTGKSFLAEAFARESGLAAIRLKNFRDRWVGSTEANLEKVLDVIESLGQILVMIDEGDRALGGGDSDGGVNSRVIARLKEFMSDPVHRGQIVFVMMTNRPDKLDTDLKRPGRFDLKIPFFPPEDAAARAAIVRAVLRRHQIEADLPDEALLPVLEPLEGYAAADLEALVLLAYDDLQSGVLPEGVEVAPAKLDARFMEQAAHDFMPSREKQMIDYMELLAVSEASNRRLLVPRYRDIEIGELQRRLAKAKAALNIR